MMIAMAIFSTVLITSMGIWPVSFQAVQKAKNTLIASHLAEQETETTISQGYSGAASRSGSYILNSTVNGVVQSLTYTYTVTVTAVSTTLKDVVVQVQWLEGANARFVKYETLLFNPS